jgi:hypothetical protein
MINEWIKELYASGNGNSKSSQHWHSFEREAISWMPALTWPCRLASPGDAVT